MVLPIFSGFGAPAVAARLADAGAVALLTADAVPRRGRAVSLKAIADAAVADAPRARNVVVWDRLGTDVAIQAGRDHRWDELVARQSPELDAPALAAEAPLMGTYPVGAAGAPRRAPVVGDVAGGAAGRPQGGRPRPGRLPREDRRGGGVPGGRPRGRPC